MSRCCTDGRLSDALDDHRHALADADAHRRQPVAGAAAAQLAASVVTSRAPEQPSGWPSAIAPPFTFSFSCGMPSSRIDASACAANASFSSTRSMSSTTGRRARAPCAWRARGRRPCTRGRRRRRPTETTRASGSGAELLQAVVGGDHDAGRAVVERRRVAGRDACRPRGRPASASRASRSSCRAAGPRRSGR